MDESVAEDLTGRRLGHYRIDGVLGKGGMSVMYRATDVRLGRKVALKVIAEHLTEDPEFRERFVDEARNTSAIDHANVVPLYDFGEVDGLLYIAMRLVDGSDLASLIKDGPLTPDRALALLGQVAEALDNLHERGLVHLDVKPANVLVTSRESTAEHIYVADFGLTRRGATGHRTRGGDFLGSPPPGPPRPPPPRRRLPRLAALRRARAPAGRAGRRAHRRVLADLRAVRMPGRAPAVPGPGAGGDPGPPQPRRARADRVRAPAAGHRRRDPPRHGEEHEGPLQELPGTDRRRAHRPCHARPAAGDPAGASGTGRSRAHE